MTNFLLITRFFVGGTIHAVWTSMFVIATEIVIENKRGVAGGVLNFGKNILTYRCSDLLTLKYQILYGH